MTSDLIVLEQWRKHEWLNRLVTDGKDIWLEYKFGDNWFGDPCFTDYWLKVFK